VCVCVCVCLSLFFFVQVKLGTIWVKTKDRVLRALLTAVDAAD